MTVHTRRISVLAALVAALAAAPASAQFASTTVTPANQSGGVGSTLVVDVVLQDPAGGIIVDAFDLVVGFDPAILEVTSVTPGAGSPFTTVTTSTIDNIVGSLVFSASGPPTDNFSLSIATIEFLAIGGGTSAVNLLSVSEHNFADGVNYGINGLATGGSIDIAAPLYIYTAAGAGGTVYNGDGIDATTANFDAFHVAVATNGDLYFSDAANFRIRKVDHSTGLISTVAGTGTSGFSGDGGPATSAQLSAPDGIGIDAAGNIYFGDAQRVRRIDSGTGIITTIAGTGNVGGYSGTGGPAISADLYGLRDIAVNAAGDVFTAENTASAVRMVDHATGIITLFAGTPGSGGSSGDGGPATSALFSGINNLAVDGSGNVYISDRDNSDVRVVDAGTGIISTVAGVAQSPGFSGDGGPATAAQLQAPQGVAVDASGNVYITDNFNLRIRMVDAVTGTISTVAGTGNTGFFGDGGFALLAELNNPVGLAAGPTGDVFVADVVNHRIRKLSTFVPPTPVTVWAPDLTSTYDQALTVPIYLDDATGIVSAEVTVEYDTDLLTFVSVDGAGTLTDPAPPDQWATEYNIEAGAGTLERVRIATAVSQSAATGQQTLTNVNFAVRDQPRVPDSSPLTLLDVLLNDGDPANTSTDGSVTLVGTAGTIASLPATFIPREDLTVTVVDVDEDTDGLPNTDQVSVTATNLNNSDVVNLTVSEDAATAGTFALVVSTEFGLAAVVDGTIQAQAGDVIEFAFDDALDAAGAGPITRTAQSTAIGGADGEAFITRATQPGDVIYLRVEDADLNTNAGLQESAVVVVTSTNGESEEVTVTEIDVDDDVFFGTLNSTAGASAGTDDDGTINAARGDVLTATYDDVVTAVGSQVDRTDDDQVVDPFGDADGNSQVQAFDAAHMLLHVLSGHIVDPLLLIQANVDLNAWATGISPFDASLILQKRVGLISEFPVQTAPSDNHPQPAPASPKALPEARILALGIGDGYLTVSADDRAGVLSGDLLLTGVERVELAPELGDFLIAQRATDEGLRVVFAGAQPVEGDGEMLRLFGTDLSQARLESAELNDGRIEALVAGVSPVAKPQTTALHGNWPNPFNPETTIRFDLAQAEQVQLEVYDALGQKVATLVSESLPAGTHQVLWRGRTASGNAVSSGVYYYRLQAGEHLQTHRMLLLK